MTAHRAELRRVGDGRWAVVFNGETIVAASPDPEPEACRVLYARGIKGRVIFHHPRGTVACGMEIEAAVDASCAINPPVAGRRAGGRVHEQRCTIARP